MEPTEAVSRGLSLVQVLAASAVVSAIVSGGVKLLVTHLASSADHRKWVREQRLEAFADLATMLSSYGVGQGWDLLKASGIASRIRVLVDDNDLHDKIIDGVDAVDELQEKYKKKKGKDVAGEEEIDKAINAVSDLNIEILDSFRDHIHG